MPDPTDSNRGVMGINHKAALWPKKSNMQTSTEFHWIVAVCYMIKKLFFLTWKSTKVFKSNKDFLKEHLGTVKHREEEKRWSSVAPVLVFKLGWQDKLNISVLSRSPQEEEINGKGSSSLERRFAVILQILVLLAERTAQDLYFMILLTF